MSKRLSVLRHAKSDWGNAGLADHDRPLNSRGNNNAAQLGILMKAEQLQPQRILCSSATRAQETAKRVMQSLGCSNILVTESDLYLASPATLLKSAKNCSDDIEHLMLVAHNPGMTELVNDISNVQLDNLPTCGIFSIDFDIASWVELSRNSKGKVHWYHYPKMQPAS
jgi:phosphohistidine phosphatase